MAPSSLSRLFLLVRVSPLEGRSFALFLTTSPLLPAPRSRCWTVSKESARKRNTQWAARPYVAVEAHSAPGHGFAPHANRPQPLADARNASTRNTRPCQRHNVPCVLGSRSIAGPLHSLGPSGQLQFKSKRRRKEKRERIKPDKSKAKRRWPCHQHRPSSTARTAPLNGGVHLCLWHGRHPFPPGWKNVALEVAHKIYLDEAVTVLKNLVHLLDWKLL